MPCQTVVSGGGSNPFGEAVDLSEMATIAAGTLVGNNGGSPAVPTDLTAAQVRTLLGLGSAALLAAGTSASNVVQLNGSAQLPAVDGSLLTGLTAGGKVAQVVSTFSAAVATGTTTIPSDDTIPQNTEGDEFLTRAITPTNASSTLIVLALLGNVWNTGSNRVIMALFQDSTANALCATAFFTYSPYAGGQGMLLHSVAAGSTTARTFKVRAGGSSAGTTTINGESGARKFGGVGFSGLLVIEVLP